LRDDVRQRGLAQARRPEQQHVVERLGALARGLDEDFGQSCRILQRDRLRQVANAHSREHGQGGARADAADFQQLPEDLAFGVAGEPE
jgi:hypothetical protein